MTVAARRGAREQAPQVPSGRIVLQPPPEITPSDGASGLLLQAVPMVGSLGTIGFVAMSQSGPRAWFTAGMFLLASVGFVLASGVRQRQQHTAGVLAARREYLAYLAEVRGTIRDAAGRQREAALWDYPDPAALPTIAAEGTRVWERTVCDADFLQVRMGATAQPLCLTLEPPETPPLAQLDPVAASALHRLLSTHQVQPALPASAALRAWARVEVTGDADPARALARSLVLSAAMQHAPEDLVVAALVSRETRSEWEWLKWLPHALSPRDRDAVGPVRLVGESVHDLLPLLPPEIVERPRFGPSEQAALPHVLLVVDGGDVPPGNPVVTPDGVLGVTVLDLPEQWGELASASTLRLAVGQALTRGPRAGTVPLEIISLARGTAQGTADQLSTVRAEAAARRLAPRYAGDEPEARDVFSGATELVDLLGQGDVRDLDPETAWRPRLQRDRLRVPIGVDEAGAVVALDIKESAQQGMGPHGLVIGATGSGKSELLRTLVLALSMTHSPEALNFVLVDFKGGATFAGMADLPHVSAVITNLGQEITLVERMQDALQGEMTRRQELLRSAGNFANVTDYERARAQGAPLEPLPALLIVADEFSELLSAKPEFADLFVAIGRLGRSLSMHLLLSSQRLEEGRLRGLESHLSYRIGLRTFSAGESRTVIGVPDAYELPAGARPGLPQARPDHADQVQGGLRVRPAEGAPPPRGHARRVRCAGRDPSVHAGSGRDGSARWRPAGGDERCGRARGDASGVRHRGEPDEGPRPARAPGLAAAARRAELDGPAARRPRAAPRAGPGEHPVARARVATCCRSASSTGRSSSAASSTCCGSVGRPGTSRSSAGRAPGARRWRAPSSPRSRSRPRRSRARSTCSTSAGAPSPRWPSWPTSPGSPTAASPRWCAGWSPRCAASSTPASATSARTASTRSRPTAAAAPRAGSTTATATSSSSSTAGPRCAPSSTSSRPRSTSSPGAGSPSGCTSSSPARGGWTSATRSATSSAPASRCGSATPATPRSTAGSPRTCPRAGPAAA